MTSQENFDEFINDESVDSKDDATIMSGIRSAYSVDPMLPYNWDIPELKAYGYDTTVDFSSGTLHQQIITLYDAYKAKKISYNVYANFLLRAGIRYCIMTAKAQGQFKKKEDYPDVINDLFVMMLEKSIPKYNPYKSSWTSYLKFGLQDMTKQTSNTLTDYYNSKKIAIMKKCRKAGLDDWETQPAGIVAQISGHSLKTIKEVQTLCAVSYASIDEYGDNISDSNHKNPESILIESEKNENVAKAFRILTPFERFVMATRYVTDTPVKKTDVLKGMKEQFPDEVPQKAGTGYVDQVESRAKRKLKNYFIRNNMFEEYYDVIDDEPFEQQISELDFINENDIVELLMDGTDDEDDTDAVVTA